MFKALNLELKCVKKKKKKVLPYLAIVRHLLAKQANKLPDFHVKVIFIRLHKYICL